MPIFSIITPVYNIKKYLPECIESVLRQDFSDYECVLIDDGSTDGSSAICNEYAEKDSRFRVIHQENSGLSIARNNGITAAKGEYIILLDGDDILAAGSALLRLFEIVNAGYPDIIYHSNLTSFTDEQSFTNHDAIETTTLNFNIHSFFNEIKNNPRLLLGSCFFAIKRSLLLQNNLFFKERILHEDNHFAPRLLCSFENIKINHNIFYGYRRQRPGSITFIMSPKRLLDSLLIVNDLRLMAHNESIPYKKQIYAYFCKSNWFYVFGAMSSFDDTDKENKNKIFKGLRASLSCILHEATLKNFALFVCIKLFGVAGAVTIRRFFRKLARKSG